ncbi:protein STICHEL-like 4 [Cynara cardunculus var. scolymus]|uniref:protein STICHEL-like 4 n=1 Tax=Cynara cardunculus var. scolymus TaxID=59895 RepID=UPI000D62D2D1|nr:protein STICHEL-like 4 [Cynara cardunculus var. scolymus]
MGNRLKTQTIKSRHVVWQRQRRSCVLCTTSINKQRALNSKATTSSSCSTTISERKAAAGVMMSHKYQPRLFQDIVGHKIVVKTLSNAIHHKKIAPLYLFHGPNGTGKTSTATVFAMALNCQSTHHTKPCCICKPCTSIETTPTICSANTIAPAFHKIKTTSSFLTTQILIIEECHLLTSEAWNELMTLVDANSSLVFLLITTHSINIPDNILSRCHKFCFPKLKDEDVTKKLSKILLHQGMKIQKQAMKLIVAKSQGSLRDAENILDQLALLGPTINTSVTQHLVGLIPQNKLLDFLAVAISGDTINTIRYAKNLSAYVEPASFLSQLATLITNVLSEGRTHSARLCYILKLLVETERKLQSSNDQTWNIIAAFLDITSVKASSITLPRSANSSSFSEVTLHSREPHRSVKGKDGMKNSSRASLSDMEKLWKDVLEGIESSHTQKFLRDQVKLASLSVSRSNANLLS